MYVYRKFFFFKAGGGNFVPQVLVGNNCEAVYILGLSSKALWSIKSICFMFYVYLSIVDLTTTIW
jgi:hypothetical protein